MKFIQVRRTHDKFPAIQILLLLLTVTLGVAHKSLPCGTLVTFRNPANGAVVTVPVIDRGPYVAGRNWDLSAATCTALSHCYTGPIQWRFP